MNDETKTELTGAIEVGRPRAVAFEARLAAGVLDEAEFERARDELAGEGRDFLLWAACVACAPRLASARDRAAVAGALPGWCLGVSATRRVEQLARSVAIALRGYTRESSAAVDDLVAVLVDRALVCVARRQALCRHACA